MNTIIEFDTKRYCKEINSLQKIANRIINDQKKLTGMGVVTKIEVINTNKMVDHLKNMIKIKPKPRPKPYGK